MSRPPVFFAFALLCLLSTLVASALAEWPTFHQNFDHTGYQSAYSNASFEKFDLLWAYHTSSPVRSSPAVADLNSDSLLEIVVGSDDGIIYMFDYFGNVMWNYSTGAAVRSSPTIADIDLDGVRDIVVGSNDGNLYVISNKGALMWKFAADGPIVSSPLVFNLADTTHPEIIFGTLGNTFYVLNYEGEVQFNYTIPGGVESSATAGDVDANGKYDIVTGSNNNLLYIFMYPPYLHWDYYVEDANILASPIISDYDLDQTREVLVFADDGKIVALRQTTYTGEQPKLRQCNSTQNAASCYREEYKYTRYTPEMNVSTAKNYSLSGERPEILLKATPALVNLNKGSRPEIIAASMDDNLYILDTLDSRDNKLVGAYTTEGSIESSPAVADFNIDGLKDIVFGSDDKKVYIIDANQTNITGADGITYNCTDTRARWVYMTGGPVRSSPAIADLDNNRALEVVVGSDDGKLYVFGDRFKWIKQFADAQYKMASDLYGRQNLTEAESYLNTSRDLYLDIKDNDGLEKVNFLQKRMLGDRLFAEAESYYNSTHYYNATEMVNRAVLVYRYVNDGQGLLKVYGFLNRIRVDSLLQEVEYYLSIGDYGNATILAEKASNYSKSIQYSGGSNKTATIMENIYKNIKASQLYIDSLESYKNEGYSAQTYSLLEKSRTAYLDANSTEGVAAIDRLIDRINGDRYYNSALDAYNKSDYKNASDSALKALDLYSKINQSEDIVKVRQIAEKSSLYVKASKFYDDAETYYLATDFVTAVEMARNARESYAQIPDDAGVLKAETLLNRSLEAYSLQTRIEIPFPLKILLAFIGLIVILRLRVIWHRRGRPGPREILAALTQAPAKVNEEVSQKKREIEYRQRFHKPQWTTVSELKSKERGRPEHPMRWFNRKIRHTPKMLKRLSGISLFGKGKYPKKSETSEAGESLAKKLDEEVHKDKK